MIPTLYHNVNSDMQVAGKRLAQTAWDIACLWEGGRQLR